MFFRPLLLGLLLPALAFGAAAGLLAGRERGATATGRLLSLLLALLFFAATAAWSGWPPFPPVTTTQQIGYAVLGAGLVAFLPGRAGRLLFLLAVLTWAAWPKIGHAWTPVAVAAIVAGWTAVLAAAKLVVEGRAARAGAFSFYAPLCVAVGGAAPVLFLGGSALLAQWDASLAALLVAGGAALRLRRRSPASPSFAGVALLAYGLLVVNALWYSSLPWPSALLLAVAPAAPALPDRMLPRDHPAWKRAAWALAAAGACVAGAGIVCWAVIRPSLSEY